MAWTDDEGLVWIYDYAFDFHKMVCYRGVDVRNFNLRYVDCAIRITIKDEIFCQYDRFNKRWVTWGMSNNGHKELMNVYQTWLSSEIEKIVL